MDVAMQSAFCCCSHMQHKALHHVQLALFNWRGDHTVKVEMHMLGGIGCKLVYSPK